MQPEPSVSPQSGPDFGERLSLALSLTLGSESFTIPGGQVKELSARLSTHGFTASVTFWTQLEQEDAPLFQAFLRQDLVRVRLSLSGVHDVPETAPDPLVLQGLALTRSLTSTTHGVLEGTPRSFRRYTIDFADAAQVLWRQHRPTELHTDKKLSELLEAHKVDPLQLTCDWDALEAQQPLLCLGLGQDARGTSFYDFLLWYVDSRDGVWTYDNQEDSYLLSGKKPRAGRPATLDARAVERVEVSCPPIPRHGTRVRNSFAVQPTTTALEQPQAATGLWQDLLLRSPLATDAEQQEALEKQRLRSPQQRLTVTFNRYPPVPVHPGAALALEGSLWPPGLKGAGKPQRVRELSLEVRSSRPEPGDDAQATTAGYEVHLSALLEAEADSVPSLPAFQRPRYPIYVEGKVVCPGGEETDKLYMLVEDEKNSLLFWRVQVPLWNKTVSVPAQPGHFPGHFYFPPYKNARVLVALYFDRAELDRFLDWGENVRLPQDGQGDELLLGKNKKSQTVISHEYKEDKPVWSLDRTSDNDMQMVRLSEGSMVLQTKEEPGSPSSTPTFDVSPQVEAAKGELASSVGGAIGETTAAYQSSMAAVSADIEGASAESMAALEAAQAAVSAEVSAARTELEGALGRLSETGAALGGAASEAKSMLKGLL